MEDVMERFGFSGDMSDADIQVKLREKEDSIRKEIRKQMKLKEGAEKLYRAATDKKSTTDAQAIVKQANNRLIELNDELQDVSAYLIMANGVTPRGEYYDTLWRQLCRSDWGCLITAFK